MKLKTKAKVLFGALIVSSLVQQLSNFSPICASGEASTIPPTSSQEFSAPKMMSEEEIAHELYTAVQRNDCNRIKELYHMGANINTREYHPIGYTPLHHAVLLNRLDAVKCLIEECGANAALPNKKGSRLTPYYLATSRDRFDILLYLAGRGICE